MKYTMGVTYVEAFDEGFIFLREEGVLGGMVLALSEYSERYKQMMGEIRKLTAFKYLYLRLPGTPRQEPKVHGC